MPKGSNTDPLFGRSRSARQAVIDLIVERDHGPDSVPQRTRQPPFSAPQRVKTHGVREQRIVDNPD